MHSGRKALWSPGGSSWFFDLMLREEVPCQRSPSSWPQEFLNWSTFKLRLGHVSFETFGSRSVGGSLALYSWSSAYTGVRVSSESKLQYPAFRLPIAKKQGEAVNSPDCSLIPFFQKLSVKHLSFFKAQMEIAEQFWVLESPTLIGFYLPHPRYPFCTSWRGLSLLFPPSQRPCSMLLMVLPFNWYLKLKLLAEMQRGENSKQPGVLASLLPFLSWPHRVLVTYLEYLLLQ